MIRSGLWSGSRLEQLNKIVAARERKEHKESKYLCDLCVLLRQFSGYAIIESGLNAERIFAVGSFLVFEEIEIGGMRRS
jgi:hypothetical protein